MPPRADVQQEAPTRSIYKVVRCAGHTLKGAQCKRKTAKTQYCYAHLEKIEHVKVKRSEIPQAGMGLFTTIKRPAHRKIVDYSGTRITRPQNTFRGDYVLETTGAHPPPYTYVDANETTAGSGRFSNMAKASDRKRNNAKLSMGAGRQTPIIVSGDKPIPAGKEILTSYGQSYWRN